jgi:hypothetical protein
VKRFIRPAAVLAAISALAAGLTLTAAPAGASTSITCTPEGCTPDLSYHGGPVQELPQVTLLLWGPGWQSDPAQERVASLLDSFYGSVFTMPDDTWLTTTAQYFDSGYDIVGAPLLSEASYDGEVYDPSPPPPNASPDSVANEIDRLNLGIQGQQAYDSQVVVLLPPSTTVDQFGSCGEHKVTPAGTPFTVLPWQGHDPTCVGYTTTASHELAESITDPTPGAVILGPPQSTPGVTGWADTPKKPPYKAEIADKCVDGKNAPLTGQVTIGGHTFRVQKLWSDIKYEVTGHGCTLGSGPQYYSTDPSGLCLAGGSPGGPVTAVTSPKDGCYDPGFLGVRITDIQGLLIIGGRCITDPKLGGAGTGLVMASCKIINGPARDQVWRYDSTHHWWVLAANGLCITGPGQFTMADPQVHLRTCADLASRQWSKL